MTKSKTILLALGATAGALIGTMAQQRPAFACTKCFRMSAREVDGPQAARDLWLNEDRPLSFMVFKEKVQLQSSTGEYSVWPHEPTDQTGLE